MTYPTGLKGLCGRVVSRFLWLHKHGLTWNTAVGRMDELSIKELVERGGLDATTELGRRADNEKTRADNEKTRADNLQAELDTVRCEIAGCLLIIERKRWSMRLNSCSTQHNTALYGAL